MWHDPSLQVATFKEAAFELIKGLKTEQDIQKFEIFILNMKKITDQAFERKRATLAGKSDRDGVLADQAFDIYIYT